MWFRSGSASSALQMNLAFLPAPACIQNIPRLVPASREPALGWLKGSSGQSSLWDQCAQRAVAKVVLWQEILSPLELPRDPELFIPGVRGAGSVCSCCFCQLFLGEFLPDVRLLWDKVWLLTLHVLQWLGSTARAPRHPLPPNLV